MEEFTKEIGDALADVAGSALNLTGEIAVGAVEIAVEGLAEGLSFAGTMAGAFLTGASEIAVTTVGAATAVTEIFTIS